MKKTIQKEVTFCDKCGREEPYGHHCRVCAVTMCFDCFRKHGVTYQHGVSFSGSGDGDYCKSCDEKLKREGTNKLHNAYREIQSLRSESDTFWADFQRRAKAVEAKVKSLAG